MSKCARKNSLSLIFQRFAAMTGLVFIMIADSSFAEETRLRRLADSYLIDKLERDGIWSTEITASKIMYKCLKCDGKVEATIELITQYNFESNATRKQHYLSERKALCVRLATLGTGRCVQTRAIGMRGGALSGFQSELEMAARKEIEIVFFYHEKTFGPELIKATVSIERGVAPPHRTIEMLRWHMAKLTVWW